MAREGADITIVYLPVEQDDAEDTKRMVESETQKCHLIPGDLRKYEFCQQVIQEHLEVYDCAPFNYAARYCANT